jgi:hypothetical protein
MNRQVTISVKALVFGGLFAILIIVGAFKIMSLERAFDNARLIVQVQQNAQNIQALDKALGDLMKQVEELKKAK